MGHSADEYDELAERIVFEDEDAGWALEHSDDEALAARIAAILREHFEPAAPARPEASTDLMCERCREYGGCSCPSEPAHVCDRGPDGDDTKYCPACDAEYEAAVHPSEPAGPIVLTPPRDTVHLKPSSEPTIDPELVRARLGAEPAGNTGCSCKESPHAVWRNASRKPAGNTGPTPRQRIAACAVCFGKGCLDCL